MKMNARANRRASERVTGRTARRAIAWSLGTIAPVLLATAPAPAQEIILAPQIVQPSGLPDKEELATVEVPPALRDLVGRLSSDVYDDREAATVRLLEERFELRQLLAVLQRDELTLEQRHRLLTVVREHLIGTPRGALAAGRDLDGRELSSGRAAPTCRAARAYGGGGSETQPAT